MNTLKGIKDILRTRLPWRWYWRLKRLREECLALLSNGSLTSLAKVYKTDKWGRHAYTPVYAQWFSERRHQPIKLLEIGIGGYAKPRMGGNSLRMWKKYFTRGQITGLDIHDKSALAERRIRIVQGDQSDSEFLQKLGRQHGPFDIIIDDGSHIQSHIITSFESLFPFLNPGGMYVIEDTQTAYWPEYEGSTRDMDTIVSCMNYFQKRIHEVNRSEWLSEELDSITPDQDLDVIAFYHNLIFIRKRN